jgi:transaldolase
MPFQRGQLKNKMDGLKRVVAIVLTFGLIIPSPAYSARPKGTAQNLALLSELSRDLLLTGQPRSEVRDLRIGFEKIEPYFTNSYASYKIGNLFKRPLSQIPDQVVNEVRSLLKEEVKKERLRGAVVHDFGGTDLDIHVTHNWGEMNASVHRLILDAARKGLEKAQDLKLLNVDMNSLANEELLRRLNMIPSDDSKIERPSESVVIAKGIGVGIGAANIKLYHEFSVPHSTPLQKLGLSKAPGFRFRVRRIQDILAGNFNGPEWEFEISEDQRDEKTQEIIIPGINETVKLLALASQPNDYQITAVYPVESLSPDSLPSHEPVATVIYQPAFGDGKQPVLNPTIIYRSQSGADAVGGIASIAFDVNFVPGGEQGQYFVATYPATLKEARKKPDPKKGLGYFVAYGYQSRKGGEIPREGYEDLIAQNYDSYNPERKLARKLAKIMASHGDAQPFLSPHAAETRVEPIREEQEPLFTAAPRESERDPLLDPLEERIREENWVVVGDDKADMGGILGHTRVPEYMIAIYKATLQEAIQYGITIKGADGNDMTIRLSDGNTFGLIDQNRVRDRENKGVGDDGHLVMLGDNSIYGSLSHQLSFLAFTRAYHYASVLSKQPYGLGQDYQGPEAKNAKANPELYSHYTDHYFELLRQYLPESELEPQRFPVTPLKSKEKFVPGVTPVTDSIVGIDWVKNRWEEWKKTGKSTQLAEPFSGNVTQQGIGSARYAFNPKLEKTFDILAGDKMGPPAFNLLIQDSVFAAADSGQFANGLVFEIWDLKAFPPGVTADNASPEQLKEIPTKRILLDAQKDRELVKRYLADSDRFNVRNVWSKKEPGWDIREPQKYLDRVLISSSVTRLGILTGGEYVGKDDPLIIGNSQLMSFLHRFLKTRPLIVQGDMNGSHWEWAVPSSLEKAVATNRSHPILASVRYTVSEDGTKLVGVEDIFGKKEYGKIRNQAYDFNSLFTKTQLSQFEPHGTNRKTVEASYELAKILRELNKPNSPFLVQNKKEKNPKRAWPVPVSNQIHELYSAVVSMRSEVRADEDPLKRIVDQASTREKRDFATQNIVFFTPPQELRGRLGVLTKSIQDNFKSFDREKQKNLLHFLAYTTFLLSSPEIQKYTLKSLGEKELAYEVNQLFELLLQLEKESKDISFDVLNEWQKDLLKIQLKDVDKPYDEKENPGQGLLAVWAREFKEKLKKEGRAESLSNWVDYWQNKVQGSHLRKLKEATGMILGNDYGQGTPMLIAFGADLVMMSPTLAYRAVRESEDLQGRVDEMLLRFLADKPGATNEEIEQKKYQLLREATVIAGLPSTKALLPIFLLTEGRRGRVSFQVNSRNYDDREAMVTDILELGDQLGREAQAMMKELLIEDVMTLQQILKMTALRAQRFHGERVLQFYPGPTFFKVDSTSPFVYGNLVEAMLKDIEIHGSMDIGRVRTGGVIEEILTLGLDVNGTNAYSVADGLYLFFAQVVGHAKARKFAIEVFSSMITKMAGRLEGALRAEAIAVVIKALEQKGGEESLREELKKLKPAENGTLDVPVLAAAANVAGVKGIPSDREIRRAGAAVSQRSHEILTELKRVLASQGAKNWETGDLLASTSKPFEEEIHGVKKPVFAHLDYATLGTFAAGFFPDIQLAVEQIDEEEFQKFLSDYEEHKKQNPSQMFRPIESNPAEKLFIDRILNSPIGSLFRKYYELTPELQTILTALGIDERKLEAWGIGGAPVEELMDLPTARYTMGGYYDKPLPRLPKDLQPAPFKRAVDKNARGAKGAFAELQDQAPRNSFLGDVNHFANQTKERAIQLRDGSIVARAETRAAEPAVVDFSRLPRTSVARLYDPKTGSNLIKLDGFPKKVEGQTWQARLKQIIEEQGPLSMTTNQTLVRQLIQSGALDERIAVLAQAGQSPAEIYAILYTEVATEAAFVFSGIHAQLDAEGRVSQEASALIEGLEPLVEAVRKIQQGFLQAGVPNLGTGLGDFTKVPNLSNVGPKAVRRATQGGVNVNVTLVFNDLHYLDTAEGYVAGLEDRLRDLKAQGLEDQAILKDLGNIFSVNSLFVSRVDRMVEQWIDEQIQLETEESKKASLRLLKGKTAVSQAKIVYRIFEAIFLGKPFEDPAGLYADDEGKFIIDRVKNLSQRFSELKKFGANPQRLLIASSGVKDDQPYHPLLYVLPFLGPYVANTLPEGTLKALSHFVAPFDDQQIETLKKRSFVTEPLPNIEQKESNKEDWVKLVLEGTKNTVTPDTVLKQVQEQVLKPRDQTLRTVGDTLRREGAKSFAKDERETIDIIRQRVEEVKKRAGVRIASKTGLEEIGPLNPEVKAGIQKVLTEIFRFYNENPELARRITDKQGYSSYLERSLLDPSLLVNAEDRNAYLAYALALRNFTEEPIAVPLVDPETQKADPVSVQVLEEVNSFLKAQGKKPFTVKSKDGKFLTVADAANLLYEVREKQLRKAFVGNSIFAEAIMHEIPDAQIMRGRSFEDLVKLDSHLAGLAAELQKYLAMARSA